MKKQANKLILILLFAALSINTLQAQSTEPLQPFSTGSNLSEFVFPKLEPAPSSTGRAPGNFTVDTTTDSEDATPGDEICEDASGNCSLRAAIQEANLIDPGSTISVPAGTYVLTVDEHGAPYFTALIMTQAMTITGAGIGQTIIDGNNTAIVLGIGGTNVAVEALTITGGSGFSTGTGTIVGGVYQLGINTVFRNVSIEGNQADEIGGIAIAGTATIEDSIITNNQALTGGGDFGTGGVLVAGPSSALTITNSTISGNSSAGVIGGIYVTGGTLILDSSTVANNTGDVSVGGIGIDDNGTATLTNVTISGNDTTGGGGGLFTIAGAIANLNNVTVADNNADDFGGGLANLGGTINISNSIVALNTSSTGPDCNGGLTSTGDNLIGDTTDGCTGAVGDILDVDPLLDPLVVSPGADTATHALQELSPAIDTANDLTCEPVDQRGVSRPQREGCDIGAYEAEPLPPTATPTITPTEGPSPTPTATEAPGTELLVNGDFENLGGDGKPDVTPWVIKNATGEKGKCNKDKDGDGIPDKIFANTGACAFQFKGVPGEAGKVEQTVDLSSVTPGVGDALNLYFAAQTKGGGEGKAKVIFKYGDDTKTKISVNVGDTGELYQAFAGSGTITSTDIVKSKVSFKLTTEAGKLYLDSVSLRLVSAGGGATETPAALLNSSN